MFEQSGRTAERERKEERKEQKIGTAWKKFLHFKMHLVEITMKCKNTESSKVK